MANYYQNKLTVLHDSAERVEEVFAAIRTEDRDVIDFNAVIPRPERLNIDHDGMAEMAMLWMINRAMPHNLDQFALIKGSDPVINGAKIQKGGGNYIKDGNGFIVFDVKVDDLYLQPSQRNVIAVNMGAPVVPFIGMMTLDEAIQFVREGFKSLIAENPDFMAEGLVIRNELGLKTRRGERIITKIKTCDFQKYRQVYGTDDPVEQHVNKHIKED